MVYSVLFSPAWSRARVGPDPSPEIIQQLHYYSLLIAATEAEGKQCRRNWPDQSVTVSTIPLHCTQVTYRVGQ